MYYFSELRSSRTVEVVFLGIMRDITWNEWWWSGSGLLFAALSLRGHGLISGELTEPTSHNKALLARLFLKAKHQTSFKLILLKVILKNKKTVKTVFRKKNEKYFHWWITFMAKITWNFNTRINNILRKEKKVIRFYGLIMFVARATNHQTCNN